MQHSSDAFERLATYRHRTLLAEAEKVRRCDQLRLPYTRKLISRRTALYGLVTGATIMAAAAVAVHTRDS
jgi:hypothetical protein